MTDRLTVWFDGTFIGTLDQAVDGLLRFRYDENYRSTPGATPLSVSMPLLARDHADASVRPWIDNLLPENDDVRVRWAREFDERRVTAFNLLKHMGADCAGAVQFLRDGETFDGVGDVVPLRQRGERHRGHPAVGVSAQGHDLVDLRLGVRERGRAELERRQ